ncbi:MAG: hypothetical protein ACI9OJ_001736 [Myxococcota bacterium]
MSLLMIMRGELWNGGAKMTITQRHELAETLRFHRRSVSSMVPRGRANPSNLYTACFEVNHKKDHVADQPSEGQYLHAEEIGARSLAQVSLDEGLPTDRPVPFGCRLDRDIQQYPLHGVPRDLMAHMAQRIGNTSVARALLLEIANPMSNANCRWCRFPIDAGHLLATGRRCHLKIVSGVTIPATS